LVPLATESTPPLSVMFPLALNVPVRFPLPIVTVPVGLTVNKPVPVLNTDPPSDDASWRVPVVALAAPIVPVAAPDCVTDDAPSTVKLPLWPATPLAPTLMFPRPENPPLPG